MYSGPKESYGTYSFTAQMDGKYEVVFDNSMSNVTPKKMSFNVLGRGTKLTYDEDPVNQEMKALNIALREIKDEQDTMIQRANHHREIANGTNSRLFWWSFFQTITLAGVCAWQVYYLKRFFEVRRII